MVRTINIMKLQSGLVEEQLGRVGQPTGPAAPAMPVHKPRPAPHHAAMNRVGRYRLDGVLGRGSAATVYRGFDLEQDKAVALKVYSEPAGDPDLHARCHREASLLGQARHDAVVRLLEHGTEAADAGVEHHYMCLELVEGADLRQLIRKARRTPAEATAWGFDLLRALAHIHGLGIVHRDVKPANILIGSDSHRPGTHAKLTDFGSAAYGEAVAPGLSLGTALYTSPEQARESAAGPASDIYSLGLVLIECLSGKPAFSGIPMAAMLARTLRRPQIPAGLPPRLAAVLKSMTAVDPGQRPAAAEAAHALAGA